jgi:hypothetical protein
VTEEGFPHPSECADVVDLDDLDDLADRLGLFEVARSAHPDLPVGMTVELALDYRGFLLVIRHEAPMLIDYIPVHVGRWQWTRQGLDLGVGQRYYATLWPLSDAPGQAAAMVLDALAEARAKVVAEWREELGLEPSADERFPCSSCGREASVQESRDRVSEAVTAVGLVPGDLWLRMQRAIGGGARRILPGWLETEDPRSYDYERAHALLDAAVTHGLMRRDGVGYVPNPARCSTCWDADPTSAAALR